MTVASAAPDDQTPAKRNDGAELIANTLSPTWPPRSSHPLDPMGGPDMAMAWRTCGLGKRHRVGMVASPTGKWGHVLDAALKHVGKGTIYAMAGNRGTGKTQLAAHLIDAAIRQFDRKAAKTDGFGPPRYVRALEVFLDIRACFRQSSSQAERDAIRGFVSPCMLVIDEMQERGETAWEDRILTHIIDVRYAEMRDTVLISNQPPGKFAEQLGPSIVDRMREGGGIVECVWESFRGAKT